MDTNSFIPKNMGFTRRRIAYTAIWLGLFLMSSLAYSQEDDRTLLGGQTTVFNTDATAFMQPAPYLEALDSELYKKGEFFFQFYWITPPAHTSTTDGSAPLFNSRSCVACHFNNGRGRPPEPGEDAPSGIIVRLSIPGQDEWGADLPDPTYGHQLQDQQDEKEGLLTITYTDVTGTFDDGTAYTLRAPSYAISELGYGNLHAEAMLSPRIGTQLIGMGLLEVVPESALLALADPDDLNGDGISGRISYVWDSVNQSQAVGRFGWKATQPNLIQQVSIALNEDMGITSPFFPQENCTTAQPICPDNAVTEITVRGVLEVVTYISALGVPAQRDAANPQVLRGQALFTQLGCESCHVATLTTEPRTSIRMLANQTIHPYTDLLLHDMGAALDGGGQEWRTPPLWGIGLFETVNGQPFYLHDGRARTLEEAILWHGGEAAAAQTAFKALSQEEREALLAFLRSL